MRLIAFLCLFACCLEAHMLHQKNVEKEWESAQLPPFDELMVSWNMDRPTRGNYLFYVSVQVKEWSPWLLYASWGSDGQSSFLSTTEESPVRVYQDALEVLEGQKATAFRIKVVRQGPAPLPPIRELHVYTNGDRMQEPLSSNASSFIELPVQGLSQMALDHVRHSDLCSPTSTTAVVRYLAEKRTIDPVAFAQNSWDGGFDIFGNWVFNAAQAALELGPAWHCWVERLSGFDAVYERLQQGTPVVVSVRSPLPGSAGVYKSGHLVAVIGYDPKEQQVICMDPAFPSDLETQTRYDLTDFVQAWERRGRVAYIFEKDML